MERNVTNDRTLRLGRVLELDETGVGYVSDVEQPLRQYIFAARQVVRMPESSQEVERDSLVWYQRGASGQVEFIVPASGLVGLMVNVGQSAPSPVTTPDPIAA